MLNNHMSERLDEPESREGLWRGIADMAGEVDELDMEVDLGDGRIVHGTIKPEVVKATLENPDYQAMMRRAAAHARSLDADRTKI